jgi:hypothetical protein
MYVTSLSVASLYTVLGSLIVATNSFHFSSISRVAVRNVQLLRPLHFVTFDTLRSSHLKARKSKRGGGDDTQDDDEEAKWDDNLADTENQMILHGEDDVISTDEWSSKTTQVGGQSL